MFRRRIQSKFDYYRYVYADESNLLWGLFGLVLTFVILPEPWSGYVLVLTAIVTVVLLGRELVGVYRKWAGVRFQRRPAMDESRFSNLGASSDQRAKEAVAWISGGPRLERTRNAPPELCTEVWFDDEVDDELLQQSCEEMKEGDSSVKRHSTDALLNDASFNLPGPLAAIAPAALRFDRKSTDRIIDPHKKRIPIRFNGRLLRLATEPTLKILRSGDCRLEQVRYFDGEASNELWRFKNFEDDQLSYDPAALDSPVRNYVLDHKNQIKMLEHSGAANIVGISVIAVTSDDHLVFVRQTVENSIAPEALAASGSGSLELRDFDLALRKEYDAVLPSAEVRERATWAQRRAFAKAASEETAIPLVRVLLRGMLREMSEESGVDETQIVARSARITGYFRWVERAMKPEFVGIVRLRCRASELPKAPVWSLEKAFTKGTMTISYEKVKVLLSAANDTCDESIDYGSIGEALNCALMAEFAAEYRQLDRAFMSPSCEHACVAAVRFLESDKGRVWLATDRVGESDIA